MHTAKDLIERARMFEERAERACDPISRLHYREMAAHYRSLSVEHQEMKPKTNRRTKGNGPQLARETKHPPPMHMRGIHSGQLKAYRLYLGNGSV
jgi:hypothetical protein